jgi:hypothetical protein
MARAMQPLTWYPHKYMFAWVLSAERSDLFAEADEYAGIHVIEFVSSTSRKSSAGGIGVLSSSLCDSNPSSDTPERQAYFMGIQRPAEDDNWLVWMEGSM